PRLSLLPMIRAAHVAPPSKLTAANRPAAGTTTLVTITMLPGLSGLTAIASSDSLLESWLTSMFLGIVAGPASAGEIRNTAAQASTSNETMATVLDFIVFSRTVPSVRALNAGTGADLVAMFCRCQAILQLVAIRGAALPRHYRWLTRACA